MTNSAVSVAAPKSPAEPIDFVRQVLEGSKARGGLTVVSIPAPLGVLEAVLDAESADGALLWSPPDGPAFAALGCAGTLVGSGESRGEQIRSQANALFSSLEHVVLGDPAPPSLRCFGGFSFQPGSAASEPWRVFGDARFMFPRIRYSRHGDHAWLSIAAGPDEAASEASRRALIATATTVLAGLRASESAGPTPRPAPRRVIGRDETSESEYRALVQSIVERIGAGEFKKVVISGRTTLSFDGLVSTTSVLRDLAETSEHCTRFAFRVGNVTFLGATPERLIRRCGLSIDTAALAGSSDGAQAAELMRSPKEREEHDLVVREIVKSLAPLCASLDYPSAPEVRVLRHLLHLTTPIRGRLREPVHALDLVLRLHPTPAVGGVPGPDAVRFITEHEPSERGWYASPIGWFDAAGDGEFAVGLRSGVVVDEKAYLYAGGGIVKDSDPASEYAETRLKLASLSAALHVAQ